MSKDHEYYTETLSIFWVELLWGAVFWLSAWGKDPVSNRVHAERGAEEEEAGGKLRLTKRGAGQTPSSR